MSCAAQVLALVSTLCAVGACPLGGWVHRGGDGLEAGHGLALVGNHVTLAGH